ncbi:PREDICTED: uncharacterized protein LOC106806661 [Priapulus caudatus]|uniref:Uncharacterized protein LOC106806661 n=1 Tax=Priapulus caudatus TaxID=37621 RepID=A0ABM1DW38_PRICU|nr:PREDICTED: uncharacterized protein LOC106806661 [Priapulus caudatus]
MLNCSFVGKNSHHRVQRFYVHEAVDTFWQEMVKCELTKRQGKPVVVAGDARMDSPGHSAKYCTYTTMDATNHIILDVSNVDVRETAMKSTNMEALGFVRGLDFLIRNLDIEEIVTDQHPQITSMIKKDGKYKDVTHQWDVWHGSKNFVTKKIGKVATRKATKPLLAWVPAVRNYFWYSAQECGGDTANMRVSCPQLGFKY